MPTLVMNDTRLETQIGELLLNVARREAMHIGFVCDGNGLCQTCECRILKGAEHLNPPNEVEQIWLTDQQLEEGRRLACQASMRGPGPVEVMTRAEEFRRQALAIISPPEGTNFGENFGRLINMVIQTNIDHVSRWPFNMFYSMSNAASTRLTIANARTVINDTWRITRIMTGTEEQTNEYLLPPTESQQQSRSGSSTSRSANPPANPAHSPNPTSAPSTPAAPPAPATPPAPAESAAPSASSPSAQSGPQSDRASSSTVDDRSSKQDPQSGRKPPRSSRR